MVIFFFIFFKIKLHECCVYSLESRHRGDSYDYTNIHFQDKIIDLKLSQLYHYISSYKKRFLWTQERVQNSRSKRANCVQATVFCYTAEISLLHECLQETIRTTTEE